MTMRNGFLLAITLVVLAVPRHALVGQSKALHSPSLSKSQAGAALPTNSVSHLSVQDPSVWIGTSKGAARSDDGGATWQSYKDVPEFARPGIFSLSLQGDTVWCATGYTQDVEGSNVQTGSGYTVSMNGGVTWSSLPQPLDARDDSLVQYGRNQVSFIPIVVPEQNVTFDVALGNGVVWVANWAGGIRRSTDHGQTWIRTVLPSSNRNSISPSDSLPNLYYKIDPRTDNNFLGFSVYVQNDSVVWAGTAGGVNRSTDGGQSWVKCTRANQSSPILSDWVIAIAGQHHAGRLNVWTTNWPAEGDDQEFGVSSTSDSGATWQNFLRGVRAYAFAFKDSIVYVATENGIYRTDDGGLSWIVSGSVVDPASGDRNTNVGYFAVGVLGDTVYAGNGDGVVATVDAPGTPFGATWTVYRAFKPVGSQLASYAYPNPFSPRFEITRIHYGTGGRDASVTVEVFDFGMNRVRTIVRDAGRPGGTEHEELWNGMDDGGTTVRNGVYFYRVLVGDEDPLWGKIMVLQ
jgi:hypothetical protein